MPSIYGSSNDFYSEMFKRNSFKKILGNKSDDDKFRIITEVDPVEGYNALMWALRTDGSSLLTILNVIETRPPEEQVELLTKKTPTGMSILNMAISLVRQQPNSLILLLNTIAKLGKNEQAKLLGEVTPEGSNILMMIAHYPQATGPIIGAIQQLNKEQQIKIITAKRNSDMDVGINVLMYAAKFHSAEHDALSPVEGILNLLEQLEDSETETKILTEYVVTGDRPVRYAKDGMIFRRDEHGELIPFGEKPITDGTQGKNALFIALQSKPMVFLPIFEAIKKRLSVIEQAKIFTQKSEGENILMLLLKAGEIVADTALTPLLNAMKTTLSEQQKVDLLIQQNPVTGFNALMLATKFYPQAVDSILQFMSNFPKEIKYQILAQLSTDENNNNTNQNALMLAATRGFRVKEILEVILDLGEEQQQKEILTQTDSLGRNALMLAIVSEPYSELSVNRIAGALERLPSSTRLQILSQKDSTGMSPLMLAMNHAPQAIPVILLYMKVSANPSQLKEMLTYSVNGKNILNMAIEKAPQYVTNVLNAIAITDLPLNDKYQILKNGLDKKSHKLTKESEILRIFWEKDLLDLLTELKPTVNQANAEPQSKLYHSLKTDLDTYLQSPKAQNDLVTFHTAWNEKIKEARKDKTLSSGYQIKDILKTVALILSVIGIIFLVHQAQKNKHENRSLFFPSKFEAKLNEIEDKANEAVAKDPRDKFNP